MHRYLIRLDNNKSYAPKDTVSLSIEMRKISDEFGSVVKNLRVSEKAIEFDLFVSDARKTAQTLEKLEQRFGKRTSERDLEEKGGKNEPLPDKELVVRESVKLFNEQRYWECHETLEQIWRREPKGPEKEVQQGIILAASALVHYQKSEEDVSLGMLPRTISKLEKWAERKYYSIDIERLKAELKAIENVGAVHTFKI